MKNTVYVFLVTSAMVVGSPCIAMDNTEQIFPKETHAGISVAQRQQIESIKNFVFERKSKDLPVGMVLGAKNTENKRITGGRWIFFDCLPHDPEGEPYIEGNFNDLKLLNALKEAIPFSLDELVVDKSTFKDTKWEEKHIRLYSEMQAPEGKFLIPPEYGGSAHGKMFQTQEEIWPFVEKNFQEDVSQVTYLKFGFPKPANTHFTDLVPKELESRPDFNAKVNQIWQKYKTLQPFLSLNEDDLDNKAREVGLEQVEYGIHIIANDEKLRIAIAKRIKAEEIDNEIIDKLYHPYFKTFFDPYYKEVVFDCKEPFPFPTNYGGAGRVVCIQYPRKL